MLNHALRIARFVAAIAIVTSLADRPMTSPLAASEEEGSKCKAGGSNWCMEGSNTSLKKTENYYCTTANACQTCKSDEGTCWNYSGYAQP